MVKKNKTPLKTKILNLIIMLSVVVIFLALIEGCSSFVLSAKGILDVPSEISKYDPLLGWTGNPGVYVSDEYGDGKYVQMNDNGFRSLVNIKNKIENDQIRILCSGDSFTFGQGVANDFAWCHQLAEKNNKLETVNLAQLGYGVDQMYLRYMKEGFPLEHSVHLFAFISGDLDRMLFDGRYGYGKPTLSIDDKTGELTPKNVPVPQFRWDLHRVINRANLRAVELIQRVLERLVNTELDNSKKVAEVEVVASRVMLEIHRNAIERNIIPIFIYLPVEGDMKKDQPWRLWALKNMKEHNLNFFDLTPMMRNLSAAEVSSFFIHHKLSAGGHYTEEGNSWAATAIYKSIQEMPDVKNLLDAPNKSTK